MSPAFSGTRPLQVFILFFFFFLPDRPTHHRKRQGRAMENETFYWDGLKKILLQTVKAELQ